MRMTVSERDARREIFAAIEDDILADAEKRVESIAPFEVETVVFGSRPTPKAYGVDGDLRFELGRWDENRFVPFADRLMVPLQPPKNLDVVYPGDVAYLWRNAFRHYTPLTRRLDYFEVWDYFSVKRATDNDVRQKALGLFAARLSKKYPAEKVRLTFRYIRFAEQYVVVTGVESREFAAAGEEERKALNALLKQK